MWLEPGNKNKLLPALLFAQLYYMVSVEIGFFFFLSFFGKKLANEATWIIKSWRKSGREPEEVAAVLPSFPGSKLVLKRSRGETFSSAKCAGRGRKRKNRIIKSKLHSWSTLLEVGKDLFERTRKGYLSFGAVAHTTSAATHCSEEKCNNIR